MAICKLLSAQIGLFYFENCINLTNSEKVIEDQYHLLNKEIEYGKLMALISDFYDSSSDNSLFYLFHDSLGYANRHKEAYVTDRLYENMHSSHLVVIRETPV